MKKLIICVAAIASFAVAAAAVAGGPDYGGKIDKGGRIGIDTDSGVNEVEAMAFKNLPAKCEGNPGFIISGSWSFGNLFVTHHEFKVSGEDSGSEIFLKGEFKNANHKVVGQIKATNEDKNFGTCTSRKRDYTAKLGGNGPVPSTTKADRVRIR